MSEMHCRAFPEHLDFFYTYSLLDEVEFDTEELSELFGPFLALSEVCRVLARSERFALLLSEVLARAQSMLNALDAQARSFLHAAPLL